MNFSVIKEMFQERKTISAKVKLSLFLVLCIPIILGILCALAMISQSASSSRSKLEERRKYKKVIHKGILWDTEILVERDYPSSSK
jgi:hypothetical protein